MSPVARSAHPIVILHPDPVYVRALAGGLHAEGYEVLAATAPEEALLAVEQFDVALLVCDLGQDTFNVQELPGSPHLLQILEEAYVMVPRLLPGTRDRLPGQWTAVVNPVRTPIGARDLRNLARGLRRGARRLALGAAAPVWRDARPSSAESDAASKAAREAAPATVRRGDDAPEGLDRPVRSPSAFVPPLAS